MHLPCLHRAGGVVTAPVVSTHQTWWAIDHTTAVVARGSSWDGWAVIAVLPDQTFTFGAYSYRADAEVVAATVAVLLAAEVSS